MCKRNNRHVVGVILGLFLVACGWGKAVATAIEVSVAACLALHPEIQDEPTMRTVCKYDEALGPVVADLISKQQAGLTKNGVHIAPVSHAVCADADAGAQMCDAGK